MSVLLEPVVAEAMEAAMHKAREEAESSAIAALTQELSARQEESGNGDMYMYCTCTQQCTALIVSGPVQNILYSCNQICM